VVQLHVHRPNELGKALETFFASLQQSQVYNFSHSFGSFPNQQMSHIIKGFSFHLSDTWTFR
jgi:hypothetical protein